VSASAAGDDGGVEPSAAPAVTQSAVVVPVPAAEPAVGRHRARLDGAAAAGVPAHVTILYPFVPPDAITAETVAGLARAVGSIAAFDCTFRRMAWFGDQVLWLAPEPDGPFRALTAAVTAAFRRGS
jgi:2'-5' RNA ligase